MIPLISASFSAYSLKSKPKFSFNSVDLLGEICSKINELSFSKDKDIRNTIRIILSNTFKVINNNGLIRIPNVILDKLDFEEFNIEYTSNNSIIVKGKILESSRGNNV